MTKILLKLKVDDIDKSFISKDDHSEYIEMMRNIAGSYELKSLHTVYKDNNPGLV